MEIRHLRYFCVLAEQLHFTKAALLLNVAQPALSHQIKQLEEELGTQLVERTNRRVRLTAAGEVFLARAARILEQLDQAAELRRLRRENEILKQEREILKKAAAFFAKEGE